MERKYAPASRSRYDKLSTAARNREHLKLTAEKIALETKITELTSQLMNFKTTLTTNQESLETAKKEKEELEGRMDFLKKENQELVALKGRVEELLGDKEKLWKEKEGMAQELAMMKEEISRLKEDRAMMERQYQEDYTSMTHSMRTRLQDKELEVDQLHEKLNLQNANLQSLKIDNERLFQEVAESKLREENLNAENRMIKKERDHNSELISRLEGVIDVTKEDYERQKAALYSTRKAAEEKEAELRGQIADLEMELGNARFIAEEREEEMRRKDDRIQQLIGNFNTLEHELLSLREKSSRTIADLKADYEELRTINDGLRSSFQTHTDEIIELRTKLETQGSELTALEKKVCNREAQIAQLNASLQMERDDFGKRETGFQDEIRTLKLQITDLNYQLAEKTKDLTEASAQISANGKKIAALENIKDMHEELVKDSTISKEDAEKRIRDLATKCDQLLSENSNFSEEVTKLKLENIDLQSSLKDAHRKHDELVGRIKELEENRKAMHQRHLMVLSAKQLSSDKLQEELDATKMQKKSFEDRLLTEQAAHGQTISEIEKLQLHFNVEERIWKGKIAELQEALKENEVKDEELRIAAREIKIRSDRVRDLEHRMELASECIKRKDEDIQELQKQITDMGSRLGAMRAERDDAKAEKLNYDPAALRGQLEEERIAHKARLHDMTVKYESLNKDCDDRLRRINDQAEEINKLEEKHNKLLEALEDKRAEVGRLEQDIKDREHELARLRQALQENDLKVADLARDKAHLNETLDGATNKIDRLRQRIASKEAKIDNLSDKIEEQKRALRQAEQDIGYFKKEAAELELQNSRLQQRITARDETLENSILKQDVQHLVNEYTRLLIAHKSYTGRSGLIRDNFMHCDGPRYVEGSKTLKIHFRPVSRVSGGGLLLGAMSVASR